MLKKLLLTLILATSITGLAIARNDYAHSATVLPTAAQTVLANNFKAKVSFVKIDKDLGRISDYEVILNDGTEISFDRNGNWDNIEVGPQGNIPSALIPKAIISYIKSAQPGQKILGIEKNRSNYEVELANGVEMKFSKDGQFIKYDN